MLLNKYEWYRKLRGGKWYYNRYHNGNSYCAFHWERKYLGNKGGNATTLKEEFWF
jgi:hypothetical protein